MSKCCSHIQLGLNMTPRLTERQRKNVLPCDRAASGSVACDSRFCPLAENRSQPIAMVCVRAVTKRCTNKTAGVVLWTSLPTSKYCLFQQDSIGNKKPGSSPLSPGEGGCREYCRERVRPRVPTLDLTGNSYSLAAKASMCGSGYTHHKGVACMWGGAVQLVLAGRMALVQCRLCGASSVQVAGKKHWAKVWRPALQLHERQLRTDNSPLSDLN